jgi:hypothetical protein
MPRKCAFAFYIAMVITPLRAQSIALPPDVRRLSLDEALGISYTMDRTGAILAPQTRNA